MIGFERSRQIIEEAIRARVFSAAAMDVGSHAASLWSDALGTRSFAEGSPAATVDTPFDLASLTKVIATTTIAMELVQKGDLRLDECLAEMFPEWRGEDRHEVTVLDLLEHASGLPARLVDAPPTGRREFEHEICSIALEYKPRSASLYSDLDFILLGFLLADRGGKSLEAQLQSIRTRLQIEGILTFDPDRTARRQAAATRPMADDPRRGRTLVGEVHDQYAAALGGVAGHAGLFGAAGAVGAFARALLRALRPGQSAAAGWPRTLVSRFATRSSVAGSSRALGWDTMLPTSSCGTRMSASTIGHTGFTGTSLWIDPERDRYFVLLTNRVCGDGTLERMLETRRAFHDALEDL